MVFTKYYQKMHPTVYAQLVIMMIKCSHPVERAKGSSRIKNYNFIMKGA